MFKDVLLIQWPITKESIFVGFLRERGRMEVGAELYERGRGQGDLDRRQALRFRGNGCVNIWIIRVMDIRLILSGSIRGRRCCPNLKRGGIENFLVRSCLLYFIENYQSFSQINSRIYMSDKIYLSSQTKNPVTPNYKIG